MTRIAAKVNPVVSGEADLHQTDTGTLQSYQSWIPTFLTNRKDALANYLVSSSPRGRTGGAVVGGVFGELS